MSFNQFWHVHPVIMHPAIRIANDDPHDSVHDDNFGKSCAISNNGMLMVVGNTSESNDLRVNMGCVRTYEWRNGWTALLGSSLWGEASDAQLGHPLVMSRNGTVIAVGSKENGGTITVYSWTNGKWQAKGDSFSFGPGTGHAIALDDSGDILAIASPFLVSPHLLQTEGTVRVFAWQATSCSWQSRGSPVFGSAYSRPGTALALSANGQSELYLYTTAFSSLILTCLPVLAISDIFFDHLRGRVRCYRWSGDDWVIHGLDLEGLHSEDSFGQ